MNIGKYLSVEKISHSKKATALGIDNVPGQDEIDNAIALAENIYDPLCEKLGVKCIPVESWYRGKALNEALKGSNTSDHLKGCAVDLDGDPINLSNKAIFNCIRDNMDFDQLIAEYPDKKGNPSWVHVGYRRAGNRKQIMRADRINNRVIYSNIRSL